MTTAHAVARRAPANRTVALARAASARTVLADLAPGAEIHCLTYGQFSLLDVIAAVLDHTGPAQVDVSTWTAGGADLTHAESFLRDGRITRLRFLVDRSFPTRQPGYCRELVRLFGDDAIRTTQTHAKFAAISAGEWRIAINTSMNMNKNTRLEYFQLADDPALHAFLTAVVDDVFAERQAGPLTEVGMPTLGSLVDVAPATSVAMGTVSAGGAITLGRASI